MTKVAAPFVLLLVLLITQKGKVQAVATDFGYSFFCSLLTAWKLKEKTKNRTQISHFSSHPLTRLTVRLYNNLACQIEFSLLLLTHKVGKMEGGWVGLNSKYCADRDSLASSYQASQSTATPALQGTIPSHTARSEYANMASIVMMCPGPCGSLPY